MYLKILVNFSTLLAHICSHIADLYLQFWLIGWAYLIINLLSVCGHISDGAGGDNTNPTPSPYLPASYGNVQMNIDNCYLYALPTS